MSRVLRLYSDFVCPFCYIAEKSSLARLIREYDLELDWRGFQLHPQTPPGGVRLDEYFPADRVPAMQQHLAEVAKHFGVDLTVPERMPNTRRALQLAEVARDEQKLEPFRAAAMDAYWQRGEDLEDTEVLRRVAGAAALPPDALQRADADPQFARRIIDTREEADAVGITGIPTFIIDSYAITGCQPFDVLEQLPQRAGVPRRG